MSQPLSLTTTGITNRLKSHFNVLDVIFVERYQCNFEEVYHRLKKIKKANFDHQDRIVFFLNDTQFYIDNHVGLVMHNLQQFLYDLDIPNYFCIIISMQDYIKKEASLVRSLYGHDSCPIDVMDVAIDYINIRDIDQLDNNFDLVEKKYMFLSRNTRKHRTLLFSLLQHNDLLDQGLVSFNYRTKKSQATDKIDQAYTKSDLSNTNLNFLKVWPCTTVCESWVISNQQFNTIYKNFFDKNPVKFNYKNFVEPEVQDYFVHNTIVQKAFLYVGIETVLHYPGTFFSEKSFKGISNKRPFVIVGPQGNLKQLKEYGFKTFGDWWDESYDDIKDPSLRMLAVFEIIKDLSKKSNAELLQILEQMRNTLEYNFEFLVNTFTQSQCDKLDVLCVKNMLPRHDVAV